MEIKTVTLKVTEGEFRALFSLVNLYLDNKIVSNEQTSEITDLKTYCNLMCLNDSLKRKIRWKK